MNGATRSFKRLSSAPHVNAKREKERKGTEKAFHGSKSRAWGFSSLNRHTVQARHPTGVLDAIYVQMKGNMNKVRRMGLGSAMAERESQSDGRKIILLLNIIQFSDK